MRSGAVFIRATEVAAPPVGVHARWQSHSAWHSPVPYLFGGLAAMLGLIALALLILACSYWRLSRYLEDDREEGGEDVDNGASGVRKASGEAIKAPTYFGEGIVVIMAGDDKPTFLATPTASRANSFGDQSVCSCSSNSSNKMDGLDDEKKADGGSNVDAGSHVSISITTENQNQEQNQNQNQNQEQ